jgi:hypothetical protein
LPWALWGGKGESGYGRLHGELGIREFAVPSVVHTKTMAKTKSLWWFGYDEATNKSLRAVADVLSAPTLGGKAQAVKALARNALKAFKGKI